MSEMFVLIIIGLKVFQEAFPGAGSRRWKHRHRHISFPADVVSGLLLCIWHQCSNACTNNSKAVAHVDN